MGIISMILLGVDDRFNRMLASELGIGLHPIDYRDFADSEIYIRFHEDTSELKGTDILLPIRGTAPGFEPMKLYLFSLFACDKLKNEYDSRVFCLLPYQPFQRQDKRWRRGEVTSLMTARRELKKHVESIVNVCLHDFREEGWRSEKDDLKGIKEEDWEKECRLRFGMSLDEFETVRHDVFSHIYNIDSNPVIGRYLVDNGYTRGNGDSITVISPDMTASGAVGTISGITGGKTFSIGKKRNTTTGVITREGVRMPPEHLIRDRDVFIADDMIATGGTMADVSKAAKSMGARKVVCVGTHPVFAEKEVPCLKKLYDSGVDDVITADTITSLPASRVELAPLIAEKLKDVVFRKYGIEL